jgi:hypothetical protein
LKGERLLGNRLYLIAKHRTDKGVAKAARFIGDIINSSLPYPPQA